MESTVITVSALTRTISMLLEEGLGFVTVQGEISNYKAHSSGHRYFTLKDEGAQISCTLWRGKPLSFQPSDGMKVVVRGNLTVYPPRGQYQIECSLISPLGKGDLFLAFEQLKRKLQDKGYFDPGRKRLIPILPMSVGVATSPTGAAVKDIFSTIQRRFPACRVYFRPTLVQGEGSSEDIVRAINELNRTEAEIIIIGRGGGSMEDLWAFNTEMVADAIYRSRKPVISAVGHETDFTIADFVADVRAATPTAAAELATPQTYAAIVDYIDSLSEDMKYNMIRKIKEMKDLVYNKSGAASMRRLREKINTFKQQIDEYESRLTHGTRKEIKINMHRLQALESHCRSLFPLSPLDKGFAILKHNDKILTNDESLSSINQVEIVRAKESAMAAIESVKSNGHEFLKR